MIGICGIYSPTNGDATWKNYMREMASSFTYRGSYKEVFHEAGPLSMGFHVYECGIPSTEGHGIISNEDQTVQLVCNGQIYRSETIRKNLEERGHRFKTSDNNEVLVHLYEEYGLDFFQHFDG